MTRRRQRGYGGILAGAILILVETVFLLKNAGILDLDSSLLWPLILVGIGIVVIAGALRAGNGGSGGAELTVVLPRPTGDVPIRIAGGAVSLIIAVPAGVQVRVTQAA